MARGLLVKYHFASRQLVRLTRKISGNFAVYYVTVAKSSASSSSVGSFLEWLARQFNECRE